MVTRLLPRSVSFYKYEYFSQGNMRLEIQKLKSFGWLHSEPDVCGNTADCHHGED